MSLSRDGQDQVVMYNCALGVKGNELSIKDIELVETITSMEQSVYSLITQRDKELIESKNNYQTKFDILIKNEQESLKDINYDFDKRIKEVEDKISFCKKYDLEEFDNILYQHSVIAYKIAKKLGLTLKLDTISDLIAIINEK